MRKGIKGVIVAIVLVLISDILIISFTIGFINDKEEETQQLKDQIEELRLTINSMQNNSADDQTVSHNTAFSDIMGFNGYYEDVARSDGWVIRTYYSDDAENSSVIAESFGYGILDYSYDIDGDGKDELLCNCTHGGDGHNELYIFKVGEEGILRGLVDWESLNLEGLSYWGTNAVSTYFDKEKGCINIVYSAGSENKTLIADFSAIKYELWLED